MHRLNKLLRDSENHFHSFDGSASKAANTDTFAGCFPIYPKSFSLLVAQNLSKFNRLLENSKNNFYSFSDSVGKSSEPLQFIILYHVGN